MRIGIRFKLVTLFSLLMAISLANYLIIKHTEKEASQQLQWVEHTYQVIHIGETLLGQLKDAETGQRGFLLTAQPEYLAPYNTGIGEAMLLLESLKTLTVDNTGQQELLEQVTDLVDRKFTELAATIEHAKVGNPDMALAIVNQDIGKDLMDQIRLKLDQFQNEEQRLLTLRKAAYESSQSRLTSLFVAEVVVLVVMILLVFLYVQKKLIRPLMEMARDAERPENSPGKFESAMDSPDEIGILARALISMHHSVRDRAAKLEALSIQLKNERDKALLSSTTDQLTGLYNRRKFEELVGRELRRAHREGAYIDLITIDIDFFKGINDTYGHATGDKVLKTIANCLKGMARRPNDFVFRIGGEEFVFLTSGQDTGWIEAYAEELRKAVEALEIPNAGSEVGDVVTISAGAVAVIPKESDTIDSLLRISDKRLYMAKSQGRNRVIACD